MITNEVTSDKPDTSTTKYAGAIVVAAILALAAIRVGLVKGGN